MFRLMCVRQFAVALILSCALALNAQERGTNHPLYELLVQYAASVPPLGKIREAAASPRAQAVAEAFLLDSTKFESWPAAITALGIVTQPLNQRIVSEKLLTFLKSGCFPPHCPPKQLGSALAMHWLREARLSVPIALGHLVNLPPDEFKSPSEWTLVGAIGGELESLAKKSQSPTVVGLCGAGKTIDHACATRLQLNALVGLSLISSKDASAALERVGRQSDNPVISREVERLLEARSRETDTKK